MIVVQIVEEVLGVGKRGGDQVDGHLVQGTGQAEGLVAAPSLEGGEREALAGGDGLVKAFAVGFAEEVAPDGKAGLEEGPGDPEGIEDGVGGPACGADELGEGGGARADRMARYWSPKMNRPYRRRWSLSAR